MANVSLVFSGPPAPFDQWHHSAHFLLHHSAELDKFGVHHVVEDPEDADIVIFAEAGEAGAFQERVRAHPYFRRYRNKCFVFEQGDGTHPTVPGLYASLTPAQYRPDHSRTGLYLILHENPFVQYTPLSGNEKYLASFVGSSATHAVREELLLLHHPDFYVLDTKDRSNRVRYHGSPAERAEFWEQYAESLRDCKFSLCPRGKSPNSIRLFESMKTGRACVILSDDWHPNDGVDWDSFCIRVPESEVQRLPEILKENEPRAAEMGRMARAEWEKWFSEPVVFHRVVEQCLDIARHRKRYSRVKSLYHYRYIVKHFRYYLTSKANLYRNNNRIYW